VCVTLDASQADELVLVLVDVQLVMRLEGAQRHAEEAEDADGMCADRQSQGADTRVHVVRRSVGEAGELPHG
jgi:hypothetical protein